MFSDVFGMSPRDAIQTNLLTFGANPAPPTGCIKPWINWPFDSAGHYFPLLVVVIRIVPQETTGSLKPHPFQYTKWWFRKSGSPSWRSGPHGGYRFSYSSPTGGVLVTWLVGVGPSDPSAGGDYWWSVSSHRAAVFSCLSVTWHWWMWKKNVTLIKKTNISPGPLGMFEEDVPFR